MNIKREPETEITLYVCSLPHLQLDIWDTAGAERYQTITHSYYAYAHAVVFVYDNSDDRSIYNLNSWIEDADRFAPDAVQILLGNKYDLTDANPASLHSGISPDKFAHDCGIEQHFKVSAKEDNRVQETFEAIARYLHYRTDLDDSTKRREQNQSFCIGISDEQVRSQTKCCTGSAYSQM